MALWQSCKSINNNNFRKINIPTLLIYSKWDKLATYKMNLKLNVKIKKSKIKIIEDRPYALLLAKSNENGFVDEIDKFISDNKR